MFTTLLESRAARTRRTGGTIISAFVHGALIAAAVALTLPNRGDASVQEKVRGLEVTYVAVKSVPTHRNTAPPRRAERMPVRTLPQLPAVAVPTFTPSSLPAVDLTGPVIPHEQIVIGGASASARLQGDDGGSPATEPIGGVVDFKRADVIPKVLGNAPSPRYPSALRASGLSGQVVLQFVIDTLGRAEGHGITVLEATHELFADAVRQALPRYRFTPGEAGGRKVRTMVKLPFTFTLQ